MVGMEKLGYGLMTLQWGCAWLTLSSSTTMSSTLLTYATYLTGGYDMD